MKDFLQAIGWYDYQALTTQQKVAGWLFIVATSAIALMANAIE